MGKGGGDQEEEGGNCAEGYSVTTRTERRTDERKVAGSILGGSGGTIFPSPELTFCSDCYFAVRSKRVLLQWLVKKKKKKERERERKKGSS